jgi:hypothetical protein
MKRKMLLGLLFLSTLILVAGKVAMYGGGRRALDTLRDTDRRWGLCQAPNTASADLGPLTIQLGLGPNSGFGLGGVGGACAYGNGSGGGGAAAAPALTNATRMFVTYTSNNSNGDYGYWLTNTDNDDTRALYAPLVEFIIHSGSTSASAIWWYGLEESPTLANLTPSNTQATGVDHAAVAFSAATSSAWRCCSGDGTNASCMDITGSTWAANTEYQVTVDLRTAGTTRCCVKDLGASAEYCVAKTTNQPGVSVNLGAMASVKTTTAASKTVSVNRIYLEQN